MKVQTSNKLAHLQVEYNELYEQTETLKAQTQIKYSECMNLSQAVSVNSGDKKVMQMYRKAVSEYNSLCNNVRRNQNKLVNLSARINSECQREQIRLAKMNMSMQRKMCSAVRSQCRTNMQNAYKTGFR